MLTKTESQFEGNQNRGMADKIKFYTNAGQNSYHPYFVKRGQTTVYLYKTRVI
jgi:ribonuclease HIII